MNGARETEPKLSLKYLLREPVVQTGNPPVIIFLHGYGSNESDLFGLSAVVPPEFLVVSARAPIVLGAGQYAWYPLDWSTGAPVGDPKEAETARFVVKKFIDEVVRVFSADTTRIYLLGFSQGAVMSYSVVLTNPNLAKGVVALSGRILDEVMQLPPPKALKTSVFVGHGTQDQVLPIHHARTAKKYLEAIGIMPEYHEYLVAHGISPQEQQDIGAWLLSV